MKLIKASYKEYSNTIKEWKYNSFSFNDINLIVGKNASGKSKILSSLSGLGQIFINPSIRFGNGTYKVELQNEKNIYKYEVDIKNAKVKSENLKIDGKVYIQRKEDGTGSIFSEESKENINFKIPDNQLIVTRQDELQHPSLSNLHLWGQNIRLFKFAKDEEKSSLVMKNNENLQRNNNSNIAIEIFKKGTNEFNSKFTDAVLKNMNEIGYNIESIKIGKMLDLKTLLPFPTELSGILVKEKGCKCDINQVAMSDGMFRALAIFIHFNYYRLKKSSGTILIDDIGEGLDFDRSSKLIKILVENSEKTNIQLIMSTNDKFIMNSVKLDYWQVISRNNSEINIYNKENSNDVFDDFKFTGLNNFDFFSNDFISQKQGEID